MCIYLPCLNAMDSHKRERNFFRLATSTEIRLLILRSLANDNHFFGGPITIWFYRIEKLYRPPFRIASMQTNSSVFSVE